MSSFAADLVAQLERAAAHVAFPRILALHLPQAASFGTKDGEFCAVELDGGAMGLSYVLLDDTLATLLGPGAGHDALPGRDALDTARWYASEAGTRKTIGFAVVNAMTRHLFDRCGWRAGDAADSIGGLDPRRGERVGMVGYFPPLVKQVTAQGASLTVLELREDLAGTKEGFTISTDPAALRGCTKLLSTSTVLLNDTLDDVLAAAADARAFVMIGPGAGCLPDALFARGVTAIGGTWIEDGAGFRAALASGEPWGRFARKTLVTRGDYPGLDALLERAR
jgi:hypothetical protein